jgi:hypothetical protein
MRLERTGVSPDLQEALEAVLSTPTGRELVEAVRRRHGRFIVDPTSLLDGASITLNVLRLAVIGADVVRAGQFVTLVESVAHEAAHLAQGYWTDSFEQEYRAFVSAARVLHELDYQDSFGWTPDLWELPLEIAAQRIQRLFPDHPLYGQRAAIPLEQRTGWWALGPIIRQAWALARSAIMGRV